MYNGCVTESHDNYSCNSYRSDNKDMIFYVTNEGSNHNATDKSDLEIFRFQSGNCTAES